MCALEGHNTRAGPHRFSSRVHNTAGSGYIARWREAAAGDPPRLGVCSAAAARPPGARCRRPSRPGGAGPSPLPTTRRARCSTRRSAPRKPAARAIRRPPPWRTPSGSAAVGFRPTQPDRSQPRPLDSNRYRGKAQLTHPAPLQPARAVFHEGMAAERNRGHALGRESISYVHAFFLSREASMIVDTHAGMTGTGATPVKVSGTNRSGPVAVHLRAGDRGCAGWRALRRLVRAGGQGVP